MEGAKFIKKKELALVSNYSYEFCPEHYDYLLITCCLERGRINFDTGKSISRAFERGGP